MTNFKYVAKEANSIKMQQRVRPLPKLYKKLSASSKGPSSEEGAHARNIKSYCIVETAATKPI